MQQYIIDSVVELFKEAIQQQTFSFVIYKNGTVIFTDKKKENNTELDEFLQQQYKLPYINEIGAGSQFGDFAVFNNINDHICFIDYPAYSQCINIVAKHSSIIAAGVQGRVNRVNDIKTKKIIYTRL